MLCLGFKKGSFSSSFLVISLVLDKTKTIKTFGPERERGVKIFLLSPLPHKLCLLSDAAREEDLSSRFVRKPRHNKTKKKKKERKRIMSRHHHCSKSLTQKAAFARQNKVKMAEKISSKKSTLSVTKRSHHHHHHHHRVVAKAAVSVPTTLKAGVVTGQDFIDVMNHARHHGYAIPAVNCTMSSVTNASLEAAKEANAPMIIQFSHGGGLNFAGKGLSNDDQKAAVAGCVAEALRVRELAKLYGVPVILHTDHCAKNLLGWFDGLLEANEKYFKENGEPLFTSHMLDLSEEPIEENLEICQKYLKRMKAINCFLEMEIGITGGEEDGVDNSDVAPEDLYSKPEEIHDVYKALQPIAPDFYSIAAAFGNVHGVYAPGNVKLTPTILGNAQKYIIEKEGITGQEKPVYFVFHGGSGSSREEIREAISYGVIKMNIDTDTQWSMWEGVRDYEAKNNGYLQTQIGNPEGADKPNKKFYDPRAWMRQAELSTVKRLQGAYEDLNAIGALAK